MYPFMTNVSNPPGKYKITITNVNPINNMYKYGYSVMRYSCSRVNITAPRIGPPNNHVPPKIAINTGRKDSSGLNAIVGSI